MHVFSFCHFSWSRGWRVVWWGVIKVTGTFFYNLSCSGGLGQRGCPGAREGPPFPQPGTAAAWRLWLLCVLWLRAGTGLCFLPSLPDSHQSWALLSAYAPWQPPSLERRHGKGPKGKELHCRVGSNVLDAIQWHCHIHMQLMGRCCTVYEDREHICKHEWQYHVANTF